MFASFAFQRPMINSKTGNTRKRQNFEKDFGIVERQVRELEEKRLKMNMRRIRRVRHGARCCRSCARVSRRLRRLLPLSGQYLAQSRRALSRARTRTTGVST
jgi:hypothetical protein